MTHQLYSGQKDNEIIQLFTETFTHSEGEAEGKLISNLVKDFLSSKSQKVKIFTSTDAKKVIGCVIFSKIQFETSNVNTFILSPMAVVTNYQGKGVGQALINLAHSALKDEGVQIVLTYGDINFYSKVGYNQISEDIIQAPLKLTYPEGWLGQSFINDKINPIKEQSYCEDALNNQVYW